MCRESLQNDPQCGRDATESAYWLTVTNRENWWIELQDWYRHSHCLEAVKNNGTQKQTTWLKVNKMTQKPIT